MSRHALRSFTLKGLLAALAAVSLLFCYVRVQFDSYRTDQIREKETVKVLLAKGGSVSWKVIQAPAIYLALANGADIFTRVDRLRIDSILRPRLDTREMDAISLRFAERHRIDFHRVAQLTHLRSLDLSGCNVRDADLAFLRPLTRLEYLDLSGNPITDQGLVFLKHHSQLKDLFLYRTHATGKGLSGSNHLRLTSFALSFKIPPDYRGPPLARADMSWLKYSTRLRRLSLEDVEMSRDQISDLARFENLELLTLANVGLTNKAGNVFPRLKKLTYLGIDGNHVSDAILRDVSSCRGLTTLSVANTLVTDEGLKYLTGMSSLHAVLARHTQITVGGVKSFKASAASPRAHVSIDRPSQSVRSLHKRRMPERPVKDEPRWEI